MYLDGVEFTILLTDAVHRVEETQTFQTFTLLHLTLLVHLEFLFRIKMPKPMN